MTNTVRDKLLAVVKARLEAIATVGLVIEPGTLGVEEMNSVLDTGKVVAEFITSDDTKRSMEPVQFEELVFELAIIAYLPPAAGAWVNRTPSSMAADIHGEFYRALAGVHAVAPIAGGTAMEAYKLDGFAESCELLEGGAAGIDPQTGAPQGFSSFEVKYRHLVGDPTQ